jgi:hypothetical protein
MMDRCCRDAIHRVSIGNVITIGNVNTTRCRDAIHRVSLIEIRV